jgi:hypothetical protein
MVLVEEEEEEEEDAISFNSDSNRSNSPKSTDVEFDTDFFFSFINNSIPGPKFTPEELEEGPEKSILIGSKSLNPISITSIYYL